MLMSPSCICAHTHTLVVLRQGIDGKGLTARSKGIQQPQDSRFNDASFNDMTRVVQ